MRFMIFGLCLAALSACASSGRTSPTEIGGAVGAVPDSGLGPQTLAAGECGLFLWSKTDVTKFIFFSRAQSGTALYNQGGQTVTLSQTSAGGDIFGQFNTVMGYAGTSGSVLELTFQPGEDLEGGQRVDDGLLTLTDTEGWRTKLPVLGVRACQPE